MIKKNYIFMMKLMVYYLMNIILLKNLKIRVVAIIIINYKKDYGLEVDIQIRDG